MDAIEAIRKRASVRAYKPDPVPREVLEELVECGNRAPSAMGVHPWHFVVVTEKAMLKKIAAATDYGKFIADAPACIVVLCEDGQYFLEDGCAAVENILIAVTAHGLGSCWVAGDKKTYAERIPRMLGAPANYRLIALLPVGYPTSTPKPKQKPGLAEVLHWEQY
ncbi:MAG: nitroreductase family protein [Armatimonadota bacterium]|nr:MAG: nitroreductase family protein [Armatimonadota bacterium]